jgi:hypothetical protein
MAEPLPGKPKESFDYTILGTDQRYTQRRMGRTNGEALYWLPHAPTPLPTARAVPKQGPNPGGKFAVGECIELA